MYIIVEYVTCVAVTGGVIALVLVGWLLLLEAQDAVKGVAKRESTTASQAFARPKESRLPSPSASPADANPLTALHLCADHKSAGDICSSPPQL